SEMSSLPSRFASPPYVYVASVSLPVTVWPAHVAVSVGFVNPLACCAVAMPMELRMLVVAPLWLVVIPVVPFQLPVPRPDGIIPLTPLYTPAVALPTGVACDTTWLSPMSVRALGAMDKALTTATPAAVP